MTLVPLHSIEVRGVEGKAGEVHPICSAPNCISKTQHRHHLWPRSYLRGQPVEWVRLPDGRVIQNTTGLCVRHHEMVTGTPGKGHEAVIVLEEGVLMWCVQVEEHSDENGADTWWQLQAPLFPQPYGMVTPKAPPTPAHAPDSADHGLLLPGQTCPSCGYTKPVPRAPGPKRPAVTWGVAVPADTEIGTDVLDGWVDDFAAVLGLGQQRTRLRRYHVLAAVLAWASQHTAQFIQDVRESSEQ